MATIEYLDRSELPEQRWGGGARGPSLASLIAAIPPGRVLFVPVEVRGRGSVRNGAAAARRAGAPLRTRRGERNGVPGTFVYRDE